jgi:hypothetical protein
MIDKILFVVFEYPVFEAASYAAGIFITSYTSQFIIT